MSEHTPGEIEQWVRGHSWHTQRHEFAAIAFAREQDAKIVALTQELVGAREWVVATLTKYNKLTAERDALARELELMTEAYKKTLAAYDERSDNALVIKNMSLARDLTQAREALEPFAKMPVTREAPGVFSDPEMDAYIETARAALSGPAPAEA